MNKRTNGVIKWFRLRKNFKIWPIEMIVIYYERRKKNWTNCIGGSASAFTRIFKRQAKQMIKVSFFLLLLLVVRHWNASGHSRHIPFAFYFSRCDTQTLTPKKIGLYLDNNSNSNENTKTMTRNSNFSTVTHECCFVFFSLPVALLPQRIGDSAYDLSSIKWHLYKH